MNPKQPQEKMLILAITEINLWEREKWTYVLDAGKQTADVLNDLFVFSRLNNQQAEKECERATNDFCAVSKYWIRFYDGYEYDDSGRLNLIHGKSRLIMNGKSNYKDDEVLFDKRISPRRLRGALNAIIDRKENIIYKKFETLFKSKLTSNLLLRRNI